MDQTVRIEHWICRRQAPRFRLGVPARLITLERHLTVTLEELSEGGARITLPVPHAFTVGVLKWMDHHAFAEVRWMRERIVGLQFASRIPAETLEQTRLRSADLLKRR
ncbi:MAG TPA: PilZ domain-containing protein [Croceibacterium sp.]